MNVLSGLRLLSVFAFPVLWGMSSVAPEIVDVVLGAKWTPSTVPLQVLALVLPLRMIGNFVATAMQGVGRSDIVLRNVIWASMISPFAFFIGASWGGLLGLSVAWLIVSPLIFVQGMMRNMPALGLRLGQLAMAMTPAAVAAFVMYGAVTATRHLLLTDQGSVMRLGVLIAVGAVAYCAVSLAFNRKGAYEVIEMLRSIATAKQQKSSEV